MDMPRTTMYRIQRCHAVAILGLCLLPIGASLYFLHPPAFAWMNKLVIWAHALLWPVTGYLLLVLYRRYPNAGPMGTTRVNLVLALTAFAVVTIYLILDELFDIDFMRPHMSLTMALFFLGGLCDAIRSSKAALRQL